MSIYQPGDLVAGRYRILEPLSQGGMGAVFLADQISLGRRVALKVILSRYQGGVAEDRFETEARAVCQLTHPNIITYHDYGRDERGNAFLVMEFLAGFPGTELVYGREIPSLEGALHVIGQLCSALHAAHLGGIIHRDLKWSNVMVVPQSQDELFTKLIDFGILKVATDGSSGDQREALTQTGMLLGTPQYMAPEQILGKQIDGRTDQYALAVMVYELLCGRRPFHADHKLELLRMQVEDEAPPMVEAADILARAPGLDGVIRRGMAKRPWDRYDSIPDFWDALAAAASLTVHDRTSPRSTPRRTTVRGRAIGTPAGPDTGSPSAHRSTVNQPAPKAPRSRAGIAALIALLFAGAGFAAVFAATSGGPGAPDGADIAVVAAPSADTGHPDIAPDTFVAGGQDAGVDSAGLAEREPGPDTGVRALAAVTDVGTGEATPDTATPPAALPPVAVEKVAKRRARRVAPAGNATLTAIALPYAEVSLNGQKIGRTPLKGVTVKAGRGTLTFVHPTYGKKTRRVNLDTNEHTRIDVNMKAP